MDEQKHFIRGQKVMFTGGEYEGMTGIIQGMIPVYTRGPHETTYRIQIDGFGKPGGWDGQVTATGKFLDKLREGK